MTGATQVRWGIIGTANIARAVFLPGLRQAGGDATAVAGREAGRAGQFARDNGIGRAVAGYQSLIDDPDIDIYWGAYLGTEDEILVSGQLCERADDIARMRADAKMRKGWIMDTYLLRRRDV